MTSKGALHKTVTAVAIIIIVVVIINIIVIVRIGILHTSLKPHHLYARGPFTCTISPHIPSRPTVSISIVIAYVTNSVSIEVFLIAVRNLRTVITSISNAIPVFVVLVSIGNSRAIILKRNINKQTKQKREKSGPQLELLFLVNLFKTTEMSAKKIGSYFV